MELPGELFGRIVAKLPLLCIFKLRLVCREWNVKLHDSHFVEEDVQLTKRAPFYVCPTSEGFAAYCPEMNRWQMWPKSFLLTMGSKYEVRGGARGLLLVQSKCTSRGASYLANPMTRSHQKLPDNEKVGHNMRILFDDTSESYKFIGLRREHIWVGTLKCGDGAPSPHIRYSNPIALHRSPLPPGNGSSRFTLLNNPTFHGGALHLLLSESPQTYGRPSHGIFRCDDTNLWQEAVAAEMPCDLFLGHIFEWQENLMLVGGKDGGHCLSSIDVWRLDRERNIWITSTSMPDSLLHRLSPPEPEFLFHFRCESGAGYIYISSCAVHGKHVGHVVCNISTRSWWELPALLSTDGPMEIGYPSFLLQPTLDKI